MFVDSLVQANGLLSILLTKLKICTHTHTERESERDVCIYIYHTKIIFTNNIYNFSTKVKNIFKGLNLRFLFW